METEKFREDFRKTVIPRNYNPWLHVTFNFGVLLSLIVITLFQVKSPKLIELLTIPIMLIIGNLAVFFIHKYPLHRRFSFLAPHTFDIHSKQHHRFFTNKMIIFDSPRDFYILFFPWWTIAAFSLLLLPGLYYALSLFLSDNIVSLTLFGATLYFLLYETVHFISHLPEGHFLVRIPPLRFMWNHHRLHHDTSLMHKYNFNIVYPLADLIFGAFRR